MRILNQDDDSAVGNVALYLTKEEAQRLRRALDVLLADQARGAVLQDEGYVHEIAVHLYQHEFQAGLGARAKRLLSQDR